MQAEENPAGKNKSRDKGIRLVDQEKLLRLEKAKSTLKSVAEKIVFEVGVGAADKLHTQLPMQKWEPANSHKAEEVMAALYQSIEARSLDVDSANGIVAELKKIVQQRIDKLRL